MEQLNTSHEQDYHFTKYNNPNPIARMLVNGFLSTYEKYLQRAPSSGKIIEVGAGDGYLTQKIATMFPSAQIVATDISQTELDQAAKKVGRESNVHFQVEDIHKLSFADSSFDFLICCEVLEHVENPPVGIRELYRILKPSSYAILSVPNEPIWRIANMLRGKYLSSWGNTEGHINHWSSHAFHNFVKSSGFEIIQSSRPFPWTMLLVRKP